MKLNFIHLCEYGLITDRGLPGIIGIFTGIQTPGFPAVHPSITVALNIQVDDHETHKVTIKIKAPSGKEIIKPFEQKIGPADAPEQGLGLLATIVNIKFEEAGVHEILILVDGQELKKLPLQVTAK